jgi:predicted DCC family thiol-disulfide oxidoreductase YuxK
MAYPETRLLEMSPAGFGKSPTLAGDGRLVGLLPVPLLDRAYGAVAHVRHRLFARPEEACPISPRELRSRLLA